MIPNCKGCREELEMAYEYQQEGYHVATSIETSSSYPNNKGHYALLIVNEQGKIILG